MKSAFQAIQGVSRLLYWIACIAISSIVALTVVDIVLRRFRMPVDFAYEIVMLLAAITVAFSMPQATLERKHVKVDFLMEKVPRCWRKAMGVFTRLLGMGIFAIFGWRVFVQAYKFSRVGQMTPSLEFPEHPIVYAVGVCCFFVCLAFLADLVRTVKEEGI